MSEKPIMSAQDVQRALARLAHEIVESNRGAEGLVLVGMRTRGVPLAQRLAAAILKFEDASVPVGALDVSLYRDDLAYRGMSSAIKPSDIPRDIDGKNVILVDDVLYTGRTVRAALDALIDFGRPRCIRLAVLVDRGHRELPIRADHVGKNVPTALTEEVLVRLVETDGRDEVVLAASD